jgi:hypothetical protein
MQRTVFTERRYAKQAGKVPIKDILVNVRQLAIELALARRWDGEVLCFKLPGGEIIPISMTAFFGSPLPSHGSKDWTLWSHAFFNFPFPPHKFWREYIRQTGQTEQFEITGVGTAEERVGLSLSEFLSFRFAGIKQWAEWIGMARRKRLVSSSPAAPPPFGPLGSLQVEVSCQTPGLRVHIAPAYFINWVYFGSPTTPVTGNVLPGRYLFAGDGPMLPTLTQDSGVFCIPPAYNVTLTRF